MIQTETCCDISPDSRIKKKKKMASYLVNVLSRSSGSNPTARDVQVSHLTWHLVMCDFAMREIFL